MITLLTAAAMAAAIDPGVCVNLNRLPLENAAVTTSEVVPEGLFQRPGGFGPPGGDRNPEPIPAHCRVTLVLTPSDDSQINVELWLPMQGWNGKFMAVGNGGWAGAIQGYGDMQAALRRGYASAATDEHPGNHIYDTIAGMGLQDRDWDWRSFDVDTTLPQALEGAGHVESNNPDLRAFKAHGGKLLLYAGWGDLAITPVNTMGYHESVLAEMGADQNDWMRLFMVPGMGHCSGGDGPYSFDTISVLEQWREQGIAPAMIPARNPASGLSRPLCAFPAAANYNGSGDIADGDNWHCEAP